MATRTWNGTVDANWGTAANWLEVAVPTSADDVVFDVLFPNPCTLNTSARVCLSIDWTNFTSTMTFTNTLTVSGNITLGASMTFAGTSALICNATATLTSNGKTCSVPLTFSTVTATFTLADAWAVSGLLALNSGTGTKTFNGQSFSASGGVSMSTNNGAATGTTTLTMTGGTWSGDRLLSLPTTLAGNVTISGTVSAPLLTYSSGTITVTGSTLSVTSTSTLNLNGMTWNNVIIAGNGIGHTLTSDLQVAGLLSLGTNNAITSVDGSGGTRTITVSGGITTTGGSGNVSGSAILLLTGGTWSSSYTSGTLRLAMTIAGNVTVSGTVAMGGSLTYSSGTITTAGSTLVCQALACTLNMAAGITWNNITLLGALTHVLTAGTTLTMNGTLTITGTAASPTSLISSVGSTTAFLTIRPTGSSNVGYCTATDIDSSAGLSVWDQNGILTRTKNWVTSTAMYSAMAT